MIKNKVFVYSKVESNEKKVIISMLDNVDMITIRMDKNKYALILISEDTITVDEYRIKIHDLEYEQEEQIK